MTVMDVKESLASVEDVPGLMEAVDGQLLKGFAAFLSSEYVWSAPNGGQLPTTLVDSLIGPRARIVRETLRHRRLLHYPDINRTASDVKYDEEGYIPLPWGVELEPLKRFRHVSAIPFDGFDLPCEFERAWAEEMCLHLSMENGGFVVLSAWGLETLIAHDLGLDQKQEEFYVE